MSEIEQLKNNNVAAVQNDGLALKFASPELQGNPEIVMAAVKNNGLALKFASPELQDNPEIVMAALENDGRALQFASTKIKDDTEIVNAALENYGNALEWASPRLRDDKLVVLTAVANDATSLQWATERVREDKTVALTAVKKDGFAIIDLSAKLRGDEDVVMTAIENDIHALQFASPELRGNKDFMIAAVKKDSRALESATDELKEDKTFIKEFTDRTTDPRYNFKNIDIPAMVGDYVTLDYGDNPHVYQIIDLKMQKDMPKPTDYNHENDVYANEIIATLERTGKNVEPDGNTVTKGYALVNRLNFVPYYNAVRDGSLGLRLKRRPDGTRVKIGGRKTRKYKRKFTRTNRAYK